MKRSLDALNSGESWNVQFGFDASYQPASQLMGHVQPAAKRLKEWVQGSGACLAAWLSGPVGCGKTTLVYAIATATEAQVIHLNHTTLEDVFTQCTTQSLSSKRRHIRIILTETTMKMADIRKLFARMPKGHIPFRLIMERPMPDYQHAEIQSFHIPTPSEMQLKAKLNQIAFAIRGPRDPIITLAVSRGGGDVRQTILQYQILCQRHETPSHDQGKQGSAKDIVFDSPTERLRWFLSTIQRDTRQAVRATCRAFSMDDMDETAQSAIQNTWRELEPASDANEMIKYRTAVDVFCDSFSLSDMLHTSVKRHHGDFWKLTEYWNIIGLCRPVLSAARCHVTLPSEPCFVAKKSFYKKKYR